MLARLIAAALAHRLVQPSGPEHADLTSTNLRQADLQKANLQNAMEPCDPLCATPHLIIPVLVLSFFGAAYVVRGQLQESAEQQKTGLNRVEQSQTGISL